MSSKELKQAIQDNEILYFQIDSEIYHGVFEINRIFYDEGKNIVIGAFNGDENHRKIIQLDPENIFTLPSHLVVLHNKSIKDDNKGYIVNKKDKFKITEDTRSYDYDLRESIILSKNEIISIYDTLFDDIVIAVREKDKHLVDISLNNLSPIKSQENRENTFSSNTQNNKIIKNFRCPICKEKLDYGYFIWNDDEGGILKGIKICKNCYDSIFNHKK